MTWKIVGLCESRSGDLEFLPEWTIGKPNEFPSEGEATIVANALQTHIDRMKQARLAAAPGVGGGGFAIKYIVLPALDDSILSQLRGTAAAPPVPQITTPAVSFSSKPA